MRRIPGVCSQRVVRLMLVSEVRGSQAPFRSRSVVSASVLFFCSGLVLSAGGFAFHALASRRLGVGSYGVLYSLISLYSLAGLPVSLFTPVVTRYSAEFEALHDDSHVRGLIGLILRVFGIVGVIYLALGFVLAVPVAHFFHISAWEIPLVGAMSAVAIVSGMLRAIGQGVHAYTAYAWSISVEGVVKVLVLALLTIVGVGVFGAAGAFLIALCAGASVMAVPLVYRYGRVLPATIILDWRRIFHTTIGAAVLTLTMTCMGFADVLIVKHFMDAHDAGIYSAASLSGKIVLYFVGFVPAVLIPQATSRHARGEKTRKLLSAAVVFILAVSFLGVIGFRFEGGLVLHALVGHQFDDALPLLPYYAAAMAALAMTNSLGSYGISTHRLGFVIPLLAGLIATLVVIVLFHHSLMAVAIEVMLGNLIMLSATAVPLLLQSRAKAAA